MQSLFILMLIIIILSSLGLSILVFLLGWFINLKMLVSKTSLSSFECGFSSNFEARNPFSLHFFLVALIFLIFDIELILLFPLFLNMSSWGVNFLIYLNSFIILLGLGLVQEWNQKMLEWLFT